MSMKIFSGGPFGFFSENTEDLSVEHGERFLRIFPRLKRGIEWKIESSYVG